MSVRQRALGVLAALAMIVALLGVPTQASAHTATGSWGSFHTLCRYSDSCVTGGNIVRLWQTILYATQPWDSSLHGCAWFVDGDFGPATAGTTARYQFSHDLDNDGWVGRNTWTQAYNRFVKFSSASSTTIYYYFDGGYTNFNIRRVSSSGAWQFQDICGGGGYVTLTHS